MSVTVKLSNGSQKTVEVPDFNVTVLLFKSLAAGALEIPAEEQRIVFRAKVLKDTESLAGVGVVSGSVLHVVRGKRATEGTTPAPSAPVPAPTPLPQPPASAAAPAQPPAPAFNPYSALFPPGAMSGLPAASVQPPAAMGVPPGFGFPTPNMQELMQNPLFLQHMQQLLQNPQALQALMQSSPQLRDTSPEHMQMVLSTMSNPTIMQEMMRMMGSGQLLGAGQNATTPDMLNTMGGFPPAAFMPPIPQGNPRELYREQLQQLRDMGFPNETANIAALQQSQGNIDFAIERLLNP